MMCSWVPSIGSIHWANDVLSIGASRKRKMDSEVPEQGACDPSAAPSEQHPPPTQTDEEASQPDDSEDLLTIKCRLSYHIYDRTLIADIVNQVKRHQEITFHGAKLLSLLVIDALENGRIPPLINQSLILKVFQACSVIPGRQNRNPNQDIDRVRDLYLAAQPPGFRWQSRR